MPLNKKKEDLYSYIVTSGPPMVFCADDISGPAALSLRAATSVNDEAHCAAIGDRLGSNGPNKMIRRKTGNLPHSSQVATHPLPRSFSANVPEPETQQSTWRMALNQSQRSVASPNNDYLPNDPCGSTEDLIMKYMHMREILKNGGGSYTTTPVSGLNQRIPWPMLTNDWQNTSIIEHHQAEHHQAELR